MNHIIQYFRDQMFVHYNNINKNKILPKYDIENLKIYFANCASFIKKNNNFETSSNFYLFENILQKKNITNYNQFILNTYLKLYEILYSFPTLVLIDLSEQTTYKNSKHKFKFYYHITKIIKEIINSSIENFSPITEEFFIED